MLSSEWCHGTLLLSCNFKVSAKRPQMLRIKISMHFDAAWISAHHQPGRTCSLCNKWPHLVLLHMLPRHTSMSLCQHGLLCWQWGRCTYCTLLSHHRSGASRRRAGSVLITASSMVEQSSAGSPAALGPVARSAVPLVLLPVEDKGRGNWRSCTSCSRG